VFYFPVMEYEYEQFPVWDMDMKISVMGCKFEHFPEMGYESNTFS
jgi:hypothetical protein